MDKISRKEAQDAVVTLLKWIGEDPNREGLKETPERVLKAFQEYFSGYEQDPYKVLDKKFGEIGNYKDIILLRNIKLISHCEHHIAPIVGIVNVAYYPNSKVVGISKIARIVDIYAKRLQIQERLTSQIADTINDILSPKGVAVYIEADHSCMSNRGVLQEGSKMITYAFHGCFEEAKHRDIFFKVLSNQNS